MLAVKDAHQTTTGNVVVRDKENNSWVLRRDWLDTSISRNEQLQKAISLFAKGTRMAFEMYDEDLHGMLLGGGIICYI